MLHCSHLLLGVAFVIVRVYCSYILPCSGDPGTTSAVIANAMHIIRSADTMRCYWAIYALCTLGIHVILVYVKLICTQLCIRLVLQGVSSLERCLLFSVLYREVPL